MLTQRIILMMFGLLTLVLLLSAHGATSLKLGYQTVQNEPPDICLNGVCPGYKNVTSGSNSLLIPDRNISCGLIEKSKLYECFNPDVALACCHICPTMNPDNGTCCKYKDRNKECSTLSNYACYSQDMAKLCCQRCLKICRKRIPDCPCGDKHSSCATISHIDCYTQHKKCCETCYNHQNKRKPDCQYGDRSTNCTVSDCLHYDLHRVEKVCCETCAAFITTPASLSENSGNRLNQGFFIAGLVLCLIILITLT